MRLFYSNSLIVTKIHLLCSLRNWCLFSSLRVILVYEFRRDLELHILVKCSSGINLHVNFFFYFLFDHTFTRAFIIIIQISNRLELVGEVLWRI